MAKCGENIYKRKDGRWEGRFIRGRRENGHAIYGYVYSRSYTECKGKLKAAATAPPRTVCACHLTADELFSSLLRQKCADVKPSTAQRYRFLIEKHILPELGHLRVEQLTAKKLQTFLQHKQANGGLRGGGLSAKTVRDKGVSGTGGFSRGADTQKEKLALHHGAEMREKQTDEGQEAPI